MMRFGRETKAKKDRPIEFHFGFEYVSVLFVKFLWSSFTSLSESRRVSCLGNLWNIPIPSPGPYSFFCS